MIVSGWSCKYQSIGERKIYLQAEQIYSILKPEAQHITNTNELES